MKIYLDMIGCRLNQSEIEVMARQFAAAGHTLVGDPAEADLAVVNTCTVTGAAAADSRKTIRKIARSGEARIVVTGCWSHMYPDQAHELPDVVQVISNLQKEHLVPNLLSLDEDIFDQEPIERVQIPGSRLRTRAFIKVQDGCRHHCTFCVTTIARGDSVSQAAETILKEIHAARNSGVNEVVLTGVQLGSWGADLPKNGKISDLVKLVLEETDLPRLRLSSIEPWDVDQDLIEIIQEERVARHLHLPLQSGSKNIMRRMSRAITPDIFAGLIDQIRNKVPDIAITTDILTGFPGETENEFEENINFIKDMGFADGHVFTYSPREGTPAFDLPHQIPPKVKKERSQKIRTLIAESAEDYRKRFIGSELTVLWEQVEKSTEDTWKASGLTDNYLRVDSEVNNDSWNTFSNVKIDSLTSHGVKGRIIPTDK